MKIFPQLLRKLIDRQKDSQTEKNDKFQTSQNIMLECL